MSLLWLDEHLSEGGDGVVESLQRIGDIAGHGSFLLGLRDGVGSGSQLIVEDEEGIRGVLVGHAGTVAERTVLIEAVR